MHSWVIDAKGRIVIEHDVGGSIASGADNARLIVAAPEMLELLRELEWSSGDTSDYGGSPYGCGICLNEKHQGHRSDCRLATLLARIEGKPNP